MTVTYLNNLEQGDFIPNCPFINPYSQISLDDASEEQEIDSDVEMYDVIILSQSCDLVRFTDNPRKIKMVLVCPYKPLSQVQLEDEGGFYRSRAGKKALKEG
ncbi:MAG TPA: hypothetical protein VKK79_05080, partial [Candidatus Lokiarchaeia archaeon]|nr:hypothetical protein [Candidatus Lokiarchaeia archaeon]